MPPTKVISPDVKAITVFLASTTTPERGGLPYLDAVLPAEHPLAATRVVRVLGALPPDGTAKRRWPRPSAHWHRTGAWRAARRRT